MAITKIGKALLEAQEKTASLINWRTAGALLGARYGGRSVLERIARRTAKSAIGTTVSATNAANKAGYAALRAAGNTGRWVVNHPKLSLLGAAMAAGAYQVPDKWRKYHLHTDPNNLVSYQGMSDIHYNQPGTEDYVRKLPLLY